MSRIVCALRLIIAVCPVHRSAHDGPFKVRRAECNHSWSISMMACYRGGPNGPVQFVSVYKTAFVCTTVHRGGETTTRESGGFRDLPPGGCRTRAHADGRMRTPRPVRLRTRTTHEHSHTTLIGLSLKEQIYTLLRSPHECLLKVA